MKTKIETVLNYKNWTGMTLVELVETGRVIPRDTKTVREFAKAALDDPKDMEEFLAREALISDVQGILDLI